MTVGMGWWKWGVVVWLCAAVAGAAEPVAPEAGGTPVADYESRLEAIGAEVDDVRAELEQLVAEVAAGDMGQVFLFLEKPSPSLRTGGVSVVVDDTTVFSRRLLPSELDVLDRGLPVELAALHLAAGEHRVAMVPVGQPVAEPALFEVERASVVAWIATPDEDGIEWREE